jgi:hypothetical protein
MLPGGIDRSQFPPPSFERILASRESNASGASASGFELPGPDVPLSSAVELKILNSESSLSDPLNSPRAIDLNKGGRGSPHSSASFYGTGDLFAVSYEHRPGGRRRRILEFISSAAILVSFFSVAGLVFNVSFDSLRAAEKVRHVILYSMRT